MLANVRFLDRPDDDQPDPVGLNSAPAPAIVAHPFILPDPQNVPPRRWLYGKHYIRSYVSASVAPGGIGKTALSIAEALAIATGRNLVGFQPAETAPVWMMSLEDPADEFARRVLAACQHFRIDRQEIAGRLFVTSARDATVTVAQTTRAGTVICRPVVEAIVTQARDNRIGLIVVDPFVSCHQVQENDNGAVNAVAAAWREVAERADCAVELIHHTRKSNGTETTVEDARGGSALHSAVRSMRAFNTMTDDEAVRAGIADRRAFFRLDRGKTSLCPPSAVAEWYRLESVDIGNATADRPSDHVGVATRWQWPDAMEGVSTSTLDAVCALVDAADPPFRPNAQAGEMWVGEAIATVLGLQTAIPSDLAKIKAVLATWLRSGALRKLDNAWQDAGRRFRPIIRSAAYLSP